jgi:hypothetical protein
MMPSTASVFSERMPIEQSAIDELLELLVQECPYQLMG